jgi:polyisoprenoid-binding protein YceI
VSSALDALVCHVDVELPMATLSAASLEHRQAVYRFDQRHGAANCRMHQRGLFAARGTLRQFSFVLILDREDPRLRDAEFAFDLTSFVLHERERPGVMSFSPWFNIAEHPMIRFRSSAATETGALRQVVRGLLEVGGATRLQVLDLAMSKPRAEPITGTRVVDLRFSGRLQQAAPGISLSQVVPSNALDVTLSCSVELEE